MNISKEILDEVALSEKEYKLIVQQLGREPGERTLSGYRWNEKPKMEVRNTEQKAKLLFLSCHFDF